MSASWRLRSRMDAGARNLALLATAALVLALVVVPLPMRRADAASCTGVTQANDFNWSDHYTVGHNHVTYCDTYSSFVVAIQRQDIAILGEPPHGALSFADGAYGNNTHLDVHAVQTGWGVTSDGLVGYTSWSGYDNYLVRNRIVSGTEYWRFSNYNANYDSFKRWFPWAGGQTCSIKVNGYIAGNWEDFNTNLGDQCS